MLPITTNLIKVGTKSRPGTKRNILFIVAHETDNMSKGAGAKNHAIYLSNVANANKTFLSWNYTVDSKSIYQHVPDDEVTWNAGDGEKTPGGNINGISIEMCVNSDGDFTKTRTNTATLIASLMYKYKLPIDAVKQHNYFSGKNCPSTIRTKGLWSSFIEQIKGEFAALQPKPVSNPVPVLIGTDYKALYEAILVQFGETQKQLNTACQALASEKLKTDTVEGKVRAYKLATAELQGLVNRINSI